MEKPVIIGWELSTNENGIKMATLPQQDLIALMNYADQCEHLHKLGVSGKQPDTKTIRAAAVFYSENHREPKRWMKTKYYCFKDFKAGAQWALSQVACATAKGEERKE